MGLCMSLNQNLLEQNKPTVKEMYQCLPVSKELLNSEQEFRLDKLKCMLMFQAVEVLYLKQGIVTVLQNTSQCCCSSDVDTQ